MGKREKLRLKMSRKVWNDHAGEVVFNSINVLERFASLLKQDIVTIAEKHRSLGFLNEQMSDVFTDLAVNQYPKAREVLNLFIGCLSQIEYARKVMYHRSHQLSQQSFQSTIEQARTVKGLLKEREAAVIKYNQAKNAQARGNNQNQDAKMSQATASFQSLNTQTIQAAGNYANQLHRDLITTLTSFAHSQMELYAKSVEVWANYIEALDQTDLGEDLDDVVDVIHKTAQSIVPNNG